MGDFDGHKGIARLASVMSQRMKKESESPMVLDFGDIQKNYSLITDTFPVPIPKGDYSVCRHVGSLSLSASGGGHAGHEGYHTGEHMHTVKLPSVRPGDRVLVAWVQSEAVVIDIVERS